MSAETLRKAAAILRERAAESEPGPWDGELDGYSSSVWREEADGQPIPIAHRASEREATYIATMHPGVGLALADVLDASAGVWAAAEQAPRPDSQLGLLAHLARLVLGFDEAPRDRGVERLHGRVQPRQPRIRSDVMSIKPVTYHTVTCDEPGCSRDTSEVSDYSAWSDAGSARDNWIDNDGIVLNDGRAFCWAHSLDKRCVSCDYEGDAVSKNDSDEYECADCIDGAS